MATYRITDPRTGQHHRVKGPDDATEEELQKFASDYFTGKAGVEPPAATGSAQSPRTPGLKPQPALDLLKDTAVGGLKSATNLSTHLVDAATTPFSLWAKGANLVAPKVGQATENVIGGIRKAGEEGRQFWQKQYEEAGPAAGVGSFAVDAATDAALGGPAYKVAKHILPKVAGETGKRAINRLSLAGAGAGGVGGALTSDDPAVGGTVGTIAGAVAPRVLRKSLLGLNKSKQAKALLDEGVPLTAGLAAPRSGAGTITTGAETVGHWLPIVGHIVENAQQKAVRGWRDAALSRTAIPESTAGPAVFPGKTIKDQDSVLDIIDAQRQAIKDREKAAVTGAKFKPDIDLENKILSVTTDPDRLLDPRGMGVIRDVYKRTMVDRVRSGAGTPGSKIIVKGGKGKGKGPQPAYLTGEDVLRAKRVFERYGAALAKNKNDPFRESTGRALQDLADDILEMVERQNKPVGQILKDLDAPKHAAKVIRGAARKSSGEGPFTPSMLVDEAKRLEHPELERLGRQGAEVFGNINTGVRSKGTDLRSLAQWLGIAGHLFSPELAVATVGGSLGYIPQVQKAALGQTTTQKKIVELLRNKGLGDLVGE